MAGKRHDAQLQAELVDEGWRQVTMYRVVCRCGLRTENVFGADSAERLKQTHNDRNPGRRNERS